MPNRHGEVPCTRYASLIRVIAEQTRELHPNATWEEVSRDLEQLWCSYVSATGIGWREVEPRIHVAWQHDGAEAEPLQ